MNTFTGVKQVTWNDCPFEQYLLLYSGGELLAYGLSEDTPLDIQELLELIFPDDIVQLTGDNYSNQYAMIITDNRPCNSAIVWNSSDYLLSEKE